MDGATGGASTRGFSGHDDDYDDANIDDDDGVYQGLKVEPAPEAFQVSLGVQWLIQLINYLFLGLEGETEKGLDILHLLLHRKTSHMGKF